MMTYKVRLFRAPGTFEVHRFSCCFEKKRKTHPTPSTSSPSGTIACHVKGLRLIGIRQATNTSPFCTLHMILLLQQLLYLPSCGITPHNTTQHSIHIYIPARLGASSTPCNRPCLSCSYHLLARCRVANINITFPPLLLSLLVDESRLFCCCNDLRFTQQAMYSSK